MKIDEDNLFIAVLLVGFVVCSPFIALYYAGKWIYGKTPKGVKERKAKEEMNRKQEEMNREIHELEKQLGLTDRDDTCTNYDPLYVGNTHREREGYLADLKKKTASGYKSPDRILMIEKTFRERGPALCHQVLLLLHEDSYNISRIGLWRADTYVKMCNSRLRLPGFVVPMFSVSERLQTLSECGNYQDYYVFPVPGRFDYQSVLEGKCDDLNKFLVDFDREYKISSDGSETSEKKE